jgi:UDP-glucose 4-epimerase
MGHEVVVVDDLSGGFLDNVPSGCLFERGNVADSVFVDDLFERHEFDYVFHLAAYAAEGLSHFIRRFNYTNNVVGSVNLINAAVRRGNVKRFVFTSSIAVYGAAQVPMAESTIPQPEDPYGVAKYAVELDLRAAREMFGLEYTVFRPHNVYGEHQNIGDKYRNVVGIFMNQIMHDKPLTIFGDGTQTRAFSYIGDVAPIIARSIQTPESAGEIFNIGADRPYRVRQLADIVAKTFGVKPHIVNLPARVEVLHAYASHEKVRTVFGEVEGVPLEIGVGRMASWARATGPRSTPEFKGVEVWKNFPAGWEGAVKR